MLLDQLVIGTKASLDDFDASLKERRISAPKKKSIKETIPFSNKTYDFSAINGEVYWEERELEYVFEIIADTPEEMENKKTRFANWVMNVMNEEIHDPYEPDWHYVGTFGDIDPADEDCLEKTTITVVFQAYPYKIANELTIYSFPIPAFSTVTKTITNDSGHRVTPTLIAEVEMTLGINGASYGVPKGESSDEVLKIEPGISRVTITNPSEVERVLNIEFYKEVF